MAPVSAYKNTVFAFDIGTNSLGWCVLSGERDADGLLIPNRIIDIGVRIFSDGRDPQSGASLAVARREARGARRMRDRYIKRRQQLLERLTEYGLMPADETARKVLLRETSDRGQNTGSNDTEKTDPYNLRARALSEKLPLHHLGRALFHLNQRRGFKSNRKTDRRDNDKGKIAMGVEELQAQLHLHKAPTLGAWLAQRYNQGKVVRIRLDSEAFTGEKQENYLFYPERSMLEDEFAAIWQAQAEFYPEELTEARKKQLFNAIFYQRPLKEPKIGKCAFNPEEERLPKAHPLFQEFRLYKEVNELTIETAGKASGQKLSKEQRDTLIDILRPQKKMAFSAIRKSLKLHSTTFKKEKNAREGLAGDEIYAEMKDKSRFGNQWADFAREKQWEIIKKLRDEENPEKLDTWLTERFPNLSAEQRDKIANAKLPEGYGRLGRTALSHMLEEMKADVTPEAEAARRCGYDHALLGRDREELDTLPKYQAVPNVARSIPPGEGGKAVAENDPDYDRIMGRITNPTVHIALNQLRRVVNALIKKHGKPQEMAVELARDLQLSDEEKKKVNKSIADNTKAARSRSDKLVELGKEDNGYNRQLLKLWEELNENPQDRCCPYSGKPISLTTLLSSDVDIDHILPFSRTLDDSNANKIVCLKEYNRQKGNLSPAEAANRLDGWNYDAMLARAQNLPKSKRWRFAKDAMERFEQEDNWLARQLTDTQYLSRLAREYLSALYPGEEADEHGELRMRYHIRTIPGKLTELFRRNWGLNDILHDRTEANDTAKPKNRQDHRHHAIDAAVIGITTRSQLKRISTASGQMEAQDLENFVKNSVRDTPPWPEFRRDLQTAVDGIIVSHKADHGTLPKAKDNKVGKGKTAAKLMKETAYGLPIDDKGERLKDAKGNELVVWRVPLRSLKAKDLENIRDSHLANALKEHIYTEARELKDGKNFEQALLSFAQTHKDYKGIRHIRLIGARNTIPIRNAAGKAYKGYWNDGNYRYDVWQTLDGKWKQEVISMYDAHQPAYQSPFHQANPTAKKVLSLQQNDMVAYNNPETGKRIIARVVKFDQRGSIYFSPHNEANVDRRNNDKNDPFKYFIKMAGPLKEWKLRQIRIDEIGQIFDPQQQAGA
ncbi:MAG: type II CRISPR RNA-guided endonuclease Cas9 [Candidatus Tokpelaia sp.]|nr:MAG: type II CRISPR RNA-guided endonuclease Cas9 [Candidatus Tokpelaia sp.]KAA6205336.1 MAG: type II CRISPR RNA-guided endonuclease Cas9 [Candidatus Tokpelaia sp.]